MAWQSLLLAGWLAGLRRPCGARNADVAERVTLVLLCSPPPSDRPGEPACCCCSLFRPPLPAEGKRERGMRCRCCLWCGRAHCSSFACPHFSSSTGAAWLVVLPGVLSTTPYFSPSFWQSMDGRGIFRGIEASCLSFWRRRGRKKGCCRPVPCGVSQSAN